MDILKQVQDHIGPEVLNKISSLLGEASENIQGASTGIISVLLGSLIQKGSNTAGAQGVINLIKNDQYTGQLLTEFGSMAMGGEQTNTLINSGSFILNFLLGHKTADLIQGVSAFAQIKPENTAFLSKLIAPLLLHTLGKKVLDSQLDTAALIRILQSQIPAVQSALPQGLSALGNTLELNQLGNKKERSPKSGRASAKVGIQGLIPWFILALGIVLLVYYFRGCDNQEGDSADEAALVLENSVDTTELIEKTVESAPGAPTTITLPNGEKLYTSEGSFSADLADYLTQAKDSTATVFTFDAVSFEDGSATLFPSSFDQLDDLAILLEAYPLVKVRIESHTDNVGDEATNLPLSKDQAAEIKRYLTKAGIASDRIEADGYGSAQAIADNGTPEGRALNRRVNIIILN